MTYTVSATDLGNIRLNEQKTVNAVLQNIALILATPKGSVPLYRDFGLSWEPLDKPMPVAQAMMTGEVREAIENWEPRARVVGVSFAGDALQPGRLIPTVEVEINAAE